MSKQEEINMEMKPYPSEHACRLNDPGKYDRMGRNNCAEKHDVKCIDVIYGIKDNKSEIQALRYPKEVWTAEDAKSHCSSRGGSFEAASEKEQEDISSSKVPDIERKTVKFSDFKMSSDGKFSALVAPFLSVDKQGDVTLPGAFGAGQPILISAYGHGSWGAGAAVLPVGKGIIRDEGTLGGVVEGQFNLNTFAGKETYETVKFSAELQEWSYSLPKIDSEMMTLVELRQAGFNVMANGASDTEQLRVLKRITVNEASPVLMGAGNGTRTLSIKGTSFVEEMERMMISAEDVYDRLKGRVENRKLVLRNPSAADLKRAREMKARLEKLARQLGDLIETHDAFTAAKMRFQKITEGDNHGTD